jgi:hypothetical protein
MNASIKCPKCGTEIDNVDSPARTVRWFSILSILPTLLIFILVFWSLWGLHRPKGDYRADLVVAVQEKRMARRGMMEILGTIDNRGKRRWEHVELDVEFYAPDGRFLDEASGRIASAIDPAKTEHFKIDLLQVSSRVEEEGVRMEVKVADAYSSPF